MDSKVLEKLLDKLNWLAPTVFSLPVNCLENPYNITWVDVDSIAYITTDFKKADYKLLYVTDTGLKYYSRYDMSDIAEKLSDNPRFMRTRRSMIVNLTKIHKTAFSSARDIWIEGTEEPLKNAVTGSTLAEFKTRFERLVP